MQSTWIITAWQSISSEETVKGFKKCCTSVAVDETGGDMLQYASEEGGNFSIECEEDEDTECEDGDSDTD